MNQLGSSNSNNIVTKQEGPSNTNKPSSSSAATTTTDSAGAAATTKKGYAISTRENSEYKWKSSEAGVLGALEVPSEPELILEAAYIRRPVQKDAFAYCLKVWDEWRMRQEFLNACKNVPAVTCCCGLLPNDDETLRALVPVLKSGWEKSVNERLVRENKGFKVNVFVWSWHNAIGKAETNILLIRFVDTGAAPESESSAHE